MKAVNSHKVTFVDVSLGRHMKMFHPVTLLLIDEEADRFTPGFHFEIERLTDKKRYWKCEYVVINRIIIPANPSWSTDHITIECERGRDAIILFRPPIEHGKMCEYGWVDGEIEMEIQNRMFTAGKTRDEAVIEVFDGTVDDAMKRQPDDL